MNIYIAHYEWVTGVGDFPFWAAPLRDQCVGGIDLRSLPNMGVQGGTPQGYGLFVYPAPVTIAQSIDVGTLDDRLTPSERNALKSFLGLPDNVPNLTIREIIMWLLTQEADVTGANRFKPIVPEQDGVIRIRLSGFSVIASEKFDPAKHPLVIPALQEDYRKVRRNTLQNGTYRKILRHWEEQYKLPTDTFIPNDLPKETSLPHNTVITDDFNRTNQNGLGTSSGGWSWTTFLGTDANCQISSNQAYLHDPSPSVARADSNLSANHYTQCTVASYGGAPTPGVLARFSESGADTFYYWRQDTGGNVLQLYKRVTGSFTQLGSNVANTEGASFTLKLTVNGSSLEGFYDAVSKITNTDTAISGTLRTGLRADEAHWDNFEAGDISAGVTITKVSGTAWSSIAKICTAATSAIAKVNGVSK